MRLGRKIALVLCAVSPALVGVACSNSSSTGGPEDGGTDGLGSDANPTGNDGGDATMGTLDSPIEVPDGSDGGGRTDADAGSTDAPHEGSSSGDADAGASQDAAEGSVGSDADASPGDAPADVPVVPDAVATDGSGFDGSFDGGCITFANTAPVVASSIGSGSPPAAIGGTVPSGTYYATSEIVYPSIDAGSGGPGLQTSQETVMFSGSDVYVAIAMGAYPDGGVGATQYLAEKVTTSGTSMTIAVTCGGGDGGWNGGTFPYSVNTSDGGQTTLSVLILNTLITLTKQ